jgi:hypothetical protein
MPAPRDERGRCGPLAFFVALLGPVALGADARAEGTTIDLLPTSNVMVGRTDDGGATRANPPISGELRLSARLSQTLSTRLQAYAFYNDGGYDVESSRITNARGAYVYLAPGRSDSIELGARYAIGNHAYLQASNYYRWWVCCPAAGDPSAVAPLAEHLDYLTFGYTSSPLGPFHVVASYGLQGALEPNHQVTAAFLKTLPPGTNARAGSAITGIAQTFALTVPLDRPGRFTAFGTFTYGAIDFFNNSVAPYYHDIFLYGLAGRLTHGFTLTAQINELTQQHLDGIPFAYPNAIHRSVLTLGGDFRLGL